MTIHLNTWSINDPSWLLTHHIAALTHEAQDACGFRSPQCVMTRDSSWALTHNDLWSFCCDVMHHIGSHVVIGMSRLALGCAIIQAKKIQDSESVTRWIRKVILLQEPWTSSSCFVHKCGLVYISHEYLLAFWHKLTNPIIRVLGTHSNPIIRDSKGYC